MAQASGPTSPTVGRHQKQEELQSYSLWKGDHNDSKLNKMRGQRNMLWMKEQDKNLQEQLNEGDKQST